jgi:hypothetical protein
VIGLGFELICCSIPLSESPALLLDTAIRVVQ